MTHQSTHSDKPQYWIGTSWKMNKLLAESVTYSEKLLAADNNFDSRIQRFVIPSYLVTRQVKQMLATTNIKVGAQNMHWDDAGAWTGEISPLMLRDCQLDMVEIGHSERRLHFGETDETVGLKVLAAVKHALLPLICVGETRKEFESGITKKVLEKQVRGALRHLMQSDDDGSVAVLFAYEPVWAIGDTGQPATPSYANEQQHFISELAGELLGTSVPCLYGGSVTLNNCEELVQCEYIAGLFIGRGAWNVENYLEILNRCSKSLDN